MLYAAPSFVTHGCGVYVSTRADGRVGYNVTTNPDGVGFVGGGYADTEAEAKAQAEVIARVFRAERRVFAARAAVVAVAANGTEAEIAAAVAEYRAANADAVEAITGRR